MPERCACCGAQSSAADEKAHNARYGIELVVAGEGRVGLICWNSESGIFTKAL